MRIPDNERIDDPLQEMDKLAKTYLDLDRWGFKESIRFHSTSPKIIYTSKYCKVTYFWEGWDYNVGYTIGILYGRLHAPDDEISMIWQGKECRCWHHIEPALHFLDGTKPQDAAKMFYRSQIIHQFRLSKLGQSLAEKRRQPEWLTRAHAAVWDHYGQRLFELFDLRHPNLWEEYQTFTKEVFKIKGIINHIKPPQDHIC